ncbi:hypothetical protein G6M84_21640 [Agrobacterium tumefaciens]|uniref:hypothetical protein n=1 Tax=Agrobacterium tumefaciens TaxID=358 RepID=UPI0015735D86|nr:hypothetical protein [Agrobacterium tumefaciens]NTB99088.1 hypothetical protein [Agrobacterium tumefaciens]NTC45035.1 hypothetical protein [Agrobacterium tumefaciens]
MDIGLIFRTGEPLDRKHYAVATALVLIVSFATWSIFHTVLTRLPLVLLLLILAVPVAFLFMFRLRRVIDIGFSSWTMAGFSMVAFTAVAFFMGNVFPPSKFSIAIVFELALLLVPTRAIIRRNR